MVQNQLLRDANIHPTDEVIAGGLGYANNVFINFTNGLKNYDITLMPWRYYNDGKVWLSKGEYKYTTKRGINKIKPIFWLSIWDGFFKISFFFKYNNKNELLTLSLSDETKEIIKNSAPMGKTKRFIPVVINIMKDSQLSDVYKLAEFKKIVE